MTDPVRPDSMEERIAWSQNASDNQELRRRYDLWAEVYDADVGTLEDYVGPVETARVARRFLASDARIMDAGAGTGLSGEGLRAEGFDNLVAVDYSAAMLAIAETKGLYRELHQCDLGRETAFAADSFDAVVTCGTTSQMPSYSLREFARVVRPGGRIVFCVNLQAFEDYGYAAILAELEQGGVLATAHKSEPFDLLPTSDHKMICEIWVIDVLA